MAKKKQNYNSNTLAELKRRNWPYEKAEQYVSLPGGDLKGYRKDLFGFIDYFACDEQAGVVYAIQSTSRAQLANHMRKIMKAGESSAQWAKRILRFTRIRILVWGWYYSEEKVNRRNWLLEEREVELATEPLPF